MFLADGTLFDALEITTIDGKNYVVEPLIDDYLFQDASLPASVTQYLTAAASTNKIQPTYYGKSGTYPTKIGALYGGATKGAYVIAKSTGFIELSLPSLSVLRSFLYGGGKNSTVKVQWKKQGDTGWTVGETFTFDQRCMAIDFTYYGVPQTTEPIIVRLNATGSNDVYMTNLVASGFKEIPGGGEPTGVRAVNGETVDHTDAHLQLTANGIIVYGDVAGIQVFDAAGRQVAQSALSQFCNLASLGKGLYVVKAQMKNGTSIETKVLRK